MINQDSVISILSEANLRFRQSMQDLQPSNILSLNPNTINCNKQDHKQDSETKNVIENGDIQKTKQENICEQSLEKKKITEITHLNEPLRISNLSERLRVYLKSHCFQVRNDILKFKDEDSLNTQVHGLNPLMFLVLSHEFELAEEMLTYPGIDLKATASAEWLSNFQGRSILDIILLLRFHPEYRIAKKEFTEAHLPVIEKISSFCPELIYRKGFYGLDIQDEAMGSPAIASVQKGDLACLKLMLKYDNFFNSNKNTELLLHIAICDDLLDIVLYLLSNNISPELPNTYGPKGNVLIDCAFVGPTNKALKWIALLLTAGIKYNAQNQDGESPLEILKKYTSFEQYPQYVKDIVNEEEIPINQEERKLLDEMLSLIDQFFNSVMSNDLKKVREYLELNLPVNVRNAAGKTPLHLACENNLAEIISLLTKNGANWTAIDDEGCTPLDRIAGYLETRSAENLAIGKPAIVQVMNIIQPLINQQIFFWMIDYIKSYEQQFNKSVLNNDLNISIFLYPSHFQRISSYAKTEKGSFYINQAIIKALESKQIFQAAKRVVAAQKEGIDCADLDAQRNWLKQYKLRPSSEIIVHTSSNDSQNALHSGLVRQNRKYQI